MNAEKLKTYLAHGAKISPTAHNLFIEHKVLEGVKVRAWKPRRKPETGPPADLPAEASAKAGDQKPEQPAATSEVPPPTSEVGKVVVEKPPGG